MSTPFATLYDQIALHAKRSSQPSWDTSIRRSARELCLRAKFPRESLALDVVANQQTYALVASNTDEEVVLIEAAQFNVPDQNLNIPLVPVMQEQVGAVVGSNGRWPCAFWLDIPGTIALYPVPPSDITSGLYVRAVLQPTLTATTLNTSLVQQHDRTIVQGALAWLLTMNGEPWSNPEQGEMFRQQFQQSIGRAMHDVGSGFMPFNMVSAIYRY